MASKFSRFTKRFFIFLNILVIFFFLLSCFSPYLHPYSWWYISLLGLAFPFLLLFMLVFMIWSVFFKKKLAIISAIALLFGFKSISTVFAFHPFNKQYKREKPSHSVRLATWNVARFLEMKKNNNIRSQKRLKMMDLIKEQNADIICMQEFFHSLDTSWYANIDYVTRKLNYPYYYFSHDRDGDRHFTGSVIFSRYPIIDSGMIRYPRPTLPDALIHADIKVNDDTIRVFTTHLQSLRFDKSDYQKIDQIKDAGDSLLANSRTIFSKLKRGVINRSIQTDIVGKIVADSPYPVVFAADLNDVPNSYAYHVIRGDKQDAFLKKGFGFGRSFTALSPTLRIDYIFADDHFKIQQFKRVLRKYSDHYMLVSDLELKK